MQDQEMIQRWKKNIVVFGELPEDMRKWAVNNIGLPWQVRTYVWERLPPVFGSGATYRLDPAYEPPVEKKARWVEHEVATVKGEYRAIIGPYEISLHDAVSKVGFDGTRWKAPCDCPGIDRSLEEDFYDGRPQGCENMARGCR